MAAMPDGAQSATFATATFDRAGHHLTVYLSGELDAASAPDIGADVTVHTQPGDARLWIDMAATTFCDSSGFRMLHALNQGALDAGSTLVIYSPSAPVREVIQLCDPDHAFKIRG